MAIPVRGFWRTIVVAATMAAFAGALLIHADRAVAQGAECPGSGIVPDSAFVVSSTNQGGAIAGHKVWFQLCKPLRVESDADGNFPRLSRIALVWQGPWYSVGGGFFLSKPEAAGITLREFGGTRSWNTTAETYSGDCCVGVNRGSIAIDFNRDIFSTDSPAGKASPLTLQFDIPLAAGMINPAKQGRYSWEIVTVYDHGGFCSVFAEEFDSSVLEIGEVGDISLWESSGPPGSTVTISGSGFEPSSPLRSLSIGFLDLTQHYKASTNDRGEFELEVIIPGVDYGIQPVVIQVGEATVIEWFTVTSSGGPSGIWPVAVAFEELGDNLVAAFHYNSEACRWAFYDPDLPYESDLTHIMMGETYWILVREPVEVILGHATRNLTCTPEGNCWNVIVW